MLKRTEHKVKIISIILFIISILIINSIPEQYISQNIKLAIKIFLSSIVIITIIYNFAYKRKI